jgi:hypothetical protein
LAQIVEATTEDRAAAIEALARCLCDHFGAPDLAVARSAAEQEIAFAATLCSHPANTLIAVHRHCEEHEVLETFRALRSRPNPNPWRAFSLVEADEDEEMNQPAQRAALASGE